jgi:hypothetical protein
MAESRNLVFTIAIIVRLNGHTRYMIRQFIIAAALKDRSTTLRSVRVPVRLTHCKSTRQLYNSFIFDQKNNVDRYL